MNEIVIHGIKNVDQRLESMKNNSYEYDWANYIVHKKKVLVKIEKDVIYAVIPHSTEPRKFVGRFYEENGVQCMKGEFKLLNHIKFLYGLFWGGIVLMCVMVAFYIAEGVVFNGMMFGLIAGMAALVLAEIWYLFRYRSKKYEQRVIDYITYFLVDLSVE